MKKETKLFFPLSHSQFIAFHHQNVQRFVKTNQTVLRRTKAKVVPTDLNSTVIKLATEPTGEGFSLTRLPPLQIAKISYLA